MAVGGWPYIWQGNDATDGCVSKLHKGVLAMYGSVQGQLSRAPALTLLNKAWARVES